MDLLTTILCLGLSFMPAGKNSLRLVDLDGSRQGTKIKPSGFGLNFSVQFNFDDRFYTEFDLDKSGSFDRFGYKMDYFYPVIDSDLVRLSPLFEVNARLDQFKTNYYGFVSVDLGIQSDITYKGFELKNTFRFGYLPLHASLIEDNRYDSANLLVYFDLEASYTFFGVTIGIRGDITSYQYFERFDMYNPTLINNGIKIYVTSPKFYGFSCELSYEHNCTHPEVAWDYFQDNNLNEAITICRFQIKYEF